MGSPGWECSAAFDAKSNIAGNSAKPDGERKERGRSLGVVGTDGPAGSDGSDAGGIGETFTVTPKS
ncbi:MAG: hypothetical protein HOQ05_11120 [Corynebacteriales bacterium]|nr:hypothetical protein [Mycobacteriales bacterium]